MAKSEINSLGFSTNPVIVSPSWTATPNREGSSTFFSQITLSASPKSKGSSLSKIVSANAMITSPSRCSLAQATAWAVPSASVCTSKIASASWRLLISRSGCLMSSPKSGPKMYTISVISRSSVRLKVSTMRSTIMVPATGNRGFGTVCECGRTRVPRPAIGIINFIYLMIFIETISLTDGEYRKVRNRFRISNDFITFHFQINHLLKTK